MWLAEMDDLLLIDASQQLHNSTVPAIHKPSVAQNKINSTRLEGT